MCVVRIDCAIANRRIEREPNALTSAVPRRDSKFVWDFTHRSCGRSISFASVHGAWVKRRRIFRLFAISWRKRRTTMKKNEWNSTPRFGRPEIAEKYANSSSSDSIYDFTFPETFPVSFTIPAIRFPFLLSFVRLHRIHFDGDGRDDSRWKARRQFISLDVRRFVNAAVCICVAQTGGYTRLYQFTYVIQMYGPMVACVRQRLHSPKRKTRDKYCLSFQSSVALHTKSIGRWRYAIVRKIGLFTFGRNHNNNVKSRLMFVWFICDRSEQSKFGTTFFQGSHFLRQLAHNWRYRMAFFLDTPTSTIRSLDEKLLKMHRKIVARAHPWPKIKSTTRIAFESNKRTGEIVMSALEFVPHDYESRRNDATVQSI